MTGSDLYKPTRRRRDMVCLARKHEQSLPYSGLGLNPHFRPAPQSHDTAVPRSRVLVFRLWNLLLALGVWCPAPLTIPRAPNSHPAAFMAIIRPLRPARGASNKDQAFRCHCRGTLGPHRPFWRGSLSRTAFCSTLILRGAATTDVKTGNALKDCGSYGRRIRCLKACEPAVMEEISRPSLAPA